MSKNADRNDTDLLRLREEDLQDQVVKTDPGTLLITLYVLTGQVLAWLITVPGGGLHRSLSMLPRRRPPHFTREA
ncbi:hypothetical protein GCM10027075_22880 [Streptomyces heilongjiangensis]